MKQAIAAIAVLSLTCLASCTQDDVANKQAAPPQATTEQATNNRSTVSIASGAATIGDGFTEDGKKIAEGYGMTYSETALDENIPALPIFGFANGQPFNAGTIVFRQDHKGIWHLEISDYKFDPVKGTAAGRAEKNDLQTIHITLPNEPNSAEELGKTMEYGDGYFQIKKMPDSTNTTSWNTAFSYKLEMDKWNKGKSKISSCGQPEIGKATGRIFISFKGSNKEGRIRNSWISGQFTDAAILYCGADSEVTL